MSKKVVIAGSASLPEKIDYWKRIWEDQGYLVTAYPRQLPVETFFEEYPRVHTEFFKQITEADILFVMNEDKNGIKGYLGAESFAEMGFGVARDLLHKNHLKIVLLQVPDSSVQSYDEIMLWLQLGWISLYAANR
ncbi:MAG: hypothetical protein UX49_C0003G0010 [Candidatus Wolfebacteria bacterium GW2011_GWC2_46_275]|uniref:Uncharacterized protein n=2 Tax=Candidatus Wolfeibacteriota TaxID=1752735 RepID=A0A0G1U822_9BACT|nr:MAG: hypothetical protein UX70_C0001G0388 [Candidatus Wolfebacteria bacterium GW2011_GWB1_47_1]KKU37048.1 MAG: hypothetical protein UX49_C0003G0010 [Candidatus Wolfebacteria bacterium GW2011_GWC2_46_275]KKU42595.1 MAG: hypothetical protein UX58_C0001G0027 [Candidatus Wolfebacteria bacterium GW2011_GWB2_46_69]KKU54670.1 MAG: hypothetical protein UX76_C0001G0129 [Candidatus Wolfebacteria bacterium GW2011_GWC1_47_103]KKU59158.1 MAG: hypothetical protein UX83_C0007G0006 [Candidatus Wolfebacteria